MKLLEEKNAKLEEKAVDEKLIEINKKLISNNNESNITINITDKWIFQRKHVRN